METQQAQKTLWRLMEQFEVATSGILKVAALHSIHTALMKMEPQ